MLVVAQRAVRTDLLLAQNLQALLRGRGVNDRELAVWCGHAPAWISKILKGDRGVRLEDLGKIAEFFGLTVAQLFHHGISTLTERRRHQRRTVDRRTGVDRRDPLRLHRQTSAGAAQMRLADGQVVLPPRMLPVLHPPKK
jgi:transcriptional regulator with XRE-family HTH domain